MNAVNEVNEVMKCILERRSIRKFRQDQITDEELETILEAGLYAPCAGGRQGVLFLVSQDREINERLGRINKLAFQGRQSTAGNFISRDQPSIADDETIASGFYGAPTVITLFGLTGFLYQESDCAAAAENMLLAAHSIGLGACMVGRACETFAGSLGKELLQGWQAAENYIPLYHVLAGYPDGALPQPKPRRENRILRIAERGGFTCGGRS